MIIENRTPHAVALMTRSGTEILEPVAPMIRLDMEAGPPIADVDGLPILDAMHVHGVQGLPPPRPGVLLLVSQLAALGIAYWHPERTDIVHPHTGRAAGTKRDKTGIVAVSAIVRVNPRD